MNVKFLKLLIFLLSIIFIERNYVFAQESSETQTQETQTDTSSASSVDEGQQSQASQSETQTQGQEEAKAQEEEAKPPQPPQTTPQEVAPSATPAVKVESKATPPAKSPFRNSAFIYENTFNAYSLKKDAQLTYNPYYAMSYSIRLRYYIWKDLYAGLRWDLEQELTNADDTTKKHQVMWSDVIFDLNWNFAAKIPVIDFTFSPKLRFELPASLASQAKTMLLSIGPGFDFTRIFDVWGGITLQWAFRYTKYFYQYTGALYEEPVLECSEGKACQYDVIGPQNPSMRFSNYFSLEVRPIVPLALSASVEIRNYLLYKVPEAVVPIEGGEVVLPSSGSTHSAYMWYVFDISYDALPYLTLSLGTSTYNPQLNPSSEYYAPFFNRFTNIYFDIALDIDGMVHAFMKKGKGKAKSSGERL